MVAKEIKSLQHPIVKELVKLRKEKKYREEKKLLLLEGKKVIFEYRGPIEVLLSTEDVIIPHHLQPKLHFIVPMEVIEKISDAPSPEPLLASVPFPPPLSLDGKTPLLALDRISDPGNLGTLFRTAVAMGFKGVFLIDCTDPYSPKALRSAKGATFHLPLQKGTESDLFNLIEKSELTPYVADINGGSPSFHSPLILILGSETHGPSETIKKRGTLVGIPTAAETESLNVAVAGGILMNKIREMTCPSLTTT
ncbi:MAG: RNA methyltransferase [Chlamydiia bacterium]|nr:RNA methyltransferase [Chlamydiia bacterium]